MLFSSLVFCAIINNYLIVCPVLLSCSHLFILLSKKLEFFSFARYVPKLIFPVVAKLLGNIGLGHICHAIVFYVYFLLICLIFVILFQTTIGNYFILIVETSTVKLFMSFIRHCGVSGSNKSALWRETGALGTQRRSR